MQPPQRVPGRLLPVLLFAFAFACVAAPPPASNAGVVTTSTDRSFDFLGLGPSDVVRVTLVDHAELSSPPEGTRVDPQGYLHLPLVGAYEVRGKPLKTVNAELREAYAQYVLEPVVTATVLRYESRSYYVLGHVEEPGMKTMDRPLTALAALSRGGSFLRGADRRHVYLIRPHDDRLEVHGFDARTPGAEGLVQVRPEDVLFVRQTGIDDFQEDILPVLAGLGFTTRNLVETPLFD